jgi:hypothetical protein
VPYFKTAERNVKTIVGLLQQMRTAGITAIDVRRSTTDAYFNWMSTQFPRFSWGSRDCHSYYTNAAGHAPFLFPGNFEQFLEFQNEIGLQDFNVIGGTETRNHQANKGEPWITSPARQQ